MCIFVHSITHILIYLRACECVSMFVENEQIFVIPQKPCGTHTHEISSFFKSERLSSRCLCVCVCVCYADTRRQIRIHTSINCVHTINECLCIIIIRHKRTCDYGCEQVSACARIFYLSHNIPCGNVLIG